MATEDINTLISNARSRAAVLTSLDNAFDNIGNVNKTPLNEVELSSQRHSDRDVFIDRLHDLLKGTGVYSRQKVEDQIKGKTIVLQHLRSGSGNAVSRLKNAHKGNCRTSNAELKERNFFKIEAITKEDVDVLRNMYWNYFKQFCSGCKNMSQVQARLLGSELTGATIFIVESLDLSAIKYIGKEGVIVGESVNCFQIAYEADLIDNIEGKRKTKKRKRRRICTERQFMDQNSISPSIEKKEVGRIEEVVDYEMKSMVVKRIIKSKCQIAIKIKSEFLTFRNVRQDESGSSRNEDSSIVCVIHGKHFLPNLQTNFNSMKTSSS